MTRVVITQSNYIPWKGYFHQLASADLVVMYDDVQYTKRDWRNRNKIMTANGPKWLSIPVQVKGKFFQPIKETEVVDTSWASKHWQTLKQVYAKAPFFKEFSPLVESWYAKAAELRYLSDINRLFINELLTFLDRPVPLRSSAEFKLIEGKSERLLDLCQQLGATTYISGPAAKSYLDTELFTSQGIAVEWFEYPEYPEYSRTPESSFEQAQPFEHGVTVLDLIFHTGGQAAEHLFSDERAAAPASALTPPIVETTL